MASKKRVFQVAREFNISNEALIGFLLKLNIDVRNQMSPINEEAYGLVRNKFGIGVSSIDEKYEFRRKLQEKRDKEAVIKEAKKRKLEERIKVSIEVAEEMPKLKKKAAKEAAALAEAKKEAAAEAAETEKKVKKRKKVIKVIELKPLREIKKAKVKAEEVKKEKAKVSDEQAPAKKRRRRRKRKTPATAVEPTEALKTLPTEGTEEEAEKKKKRKRRRRRKKSQAEQEGAVEVKVTAKKKVSKRKKPRFDDEEIEETIKETLAAIEGISKVRHRKRRPKEVSEEEDGEDNLLRVPEFISAGELAELMDVESAQVLQKCMELGMMVSINQRLDADTIVMVADEFDYDVEIIHDYGTDFLDDKEEEEDEKLFKERPPVVTIMGHVDHGKTSLLDYIRSSNIISQEAGGITQHIGAYEVFVNGKAITFLDTPGHEAFTAMRARGAQATDIVVLVIAADDSVMPQTIEAINHAKAAGVSIIVAINKMDKPGANSELIRKQLSENGVLVEDWGGKYQCIEISAKTGQGIDKLLELILLEAEVMELQANPDRLAKGVVIESRLDKGKGVIASVLVQKGSLKIGDPFISGQHSGKVRSMFNEFGKRVKIAGPAVPVAVLGFNGIPVAGDSFRVLESEKETKDISQKRQQLRREQEQRRIRPSSLDQISQQIKRGEIKELLVVLKGDVTGSIEAIADSLSELSNEEVAIRVIHSGAGAITESDVLLATASGAIIIGFHVRPTLKARELAKLNQVDIRLYNVIYDIKDDMKSALEGFLKPHISEQLTGTIEIRQIFKVPRIGMVAGGYVLSGKIIRNDRAKLYRDDKLIHDGKISSLRRFKDDVKEVSSGFECGIGLERYDDVKVNDIIETYNIVEEKRTL